MEARLLMRGVLRLPARLVRRALRRRPGPAAVVLALAVAFAGVAVASAASRSLIPYGLDGEVEVLELRFRERLQNEAVYVAVIDGRRFVLDREVAELLEQGDIVRKRPFERALRTEHGELPLSLSWPGGRILRTLPVTLGAVVAALVLDRPRRRVPDVGGAARRRPPWWA